jgi:hypothetical protein
MVRFVWLRNTAREVEIRVKESLWRVGVEQLYLSLVGRSAADLHLRLLAMIFEDFRNICLAKERRRVLPLATSRRKEGPQIFRRVKKRRTNMFLQMSLSVFERNTTPPSPKKCPRSHTHNETRSIHLSPRFEMKGHIGRRYRRSCCAYKHSIAWRDGNDTTGIWPPKDAGSWMMHCRVGWSGVVSARRQRQRRR